MPEMKEHGVVSFPKCGRTWIRLFLDYYRLFTGMEYSTVRVFFRHDDRFDYEKRVLLMRHPCDVMVSYHIHRRLRRRSKAPIGYFIRSNHMGIPLFNKWYTIWAEREDAQLVIRYEDMFEAGVWREMLEFWDIPLHEEAFDKAIEKTKFDNIRTNLKEVKQFPSAWRYLAAMHSRYNLLEPKDPEAHKFRRGIAGGYVDYLCEEDIDYILENFTLGERLESYRQQYLLESEGYRVCDV